MPTKYPEIFRALAEPFDPAEVKTRPGGQGRQLYYVTATTVANRLDSVLGPEAWDFELAPWGEGALLGTLVVRLPDGTTVRKSNVGGKADMQAADDDAKSAASDCLKRCATLLGVARYLYRDGVPTFVSASPSHGPASVEAEVPAREVVADAIRREVENRPRGGFSPQTGPELVGWMKKREREYPGLTSRLHAWAATAKLPVRVLGWDTATVLRAYKAVQAAINAMDAERQGAGDEAEGPVPARPNGAYPRNGRNGKTAP